MNPTACCVVMYHYVRDARRTPFPVLNALAVADFEAQLDFLQSRFTVIDYPTFERLLAGDGPDGGPSALLTFDDGFVDHWQTVFPILTRRQLGGYFS